MIETFFVHEIGRGRDVEERSTLGRADRVSVRHCGGVGHGRSQVASRRGGRVFTIARPGMTDDVRRVSSRAAAAIPLTVNR